MPDPISISSSIIDASAESKRIEVARMRGEQTAEMKWLGKLLKGNGLK